MVMFRRCDSEEVDVTARQAISDLSLGAWQVQTLALETRQEDLHFCALWTIDVVSTDHLPCKKYGTDTEKQRQIHAIH
jgi:hypothetical protein